MEWTPGGVSGDIEDRRGDSGGPGFGGFGGFRFGLGGTLVLLILSVVFHQNFFALFSGGGGGGAPAAYSHRSGPITQTPEEQKEVQFVSFVLDNVQSTWEKLLPQQARRDYRHAKLVLYRDVTDSACGTAQSATGPFYCPNDEKVYLDLGFFDELRSRFGAPGEFAQAYVIAHELGHHVQKILGIEQKISRLEQEYPQEANRFSVRLELQADCLAGVWGHQTEQQQLIKQSDISDALRAAAAVGDDRLQRMANGVVNPETFTHGSSQQRMRWFSQGIQSGEVSACSMQLPSE